MRYYTSAKLHIALVLHNQGEWACKISCSLTGPWIHCLAQDPILSNKLARFLSLYSKLSSQVRLLFAGMNGIII